MRSKLFDDRPQTVNTSAERWVHVIPEKGDGYQLYDALQKIFIGRILFDADDNWIYDGEVLHVNEQEDVAGFITGNHKEMDKLIRSL